MKTVQTVSRGNVATILIVEDAEGFQALILRTLSHHSLLIATDVKTARSYLASQHIDLVLMDLNLPDESGYTLLSEIQSLDKPVAAICLTGRTGISDKVTAFSMGVEDYIVKPFDPLELRARVDARLQKLFSSDGDKKRMAVGDLIIDQSTHRTYLMRENKKEEVVLTQTEFKILCCLARRPEQVFTRDQLLVAAWGDDAKVLDRAVDVHVCAIRKKLGDSHSCYIKSVPGVGYKLTLDPSRSRAIAI